MENLLIALLVPALGGLAWLAYFHPQPFRKIADTLRSITFACAFGISIWNLSAKTELITAKSAIYEDKQLPQLSQELAVSAVTRASEANELPMLKLSIGFVIWFSYLMFLRFMPDILGLDKQSKP